MCRIERDLTKVPAFLKSEEKAPSRAAQMVGEIEAKLKQLGALPEPKRETLATEKETPKKLAKRRAEMQAQIVRGVKMTDLWGEHETLARWQRFTKVSEMKANKTRRTKRKLTEFLATPNSLTFKERQAMLGKKPSKKPEPYVQQMQITIPPLKQS